jgi:hypothetical protein
MCCDGIGDGDLMVDAHRHENQLYEAFKHAHHARRRGIKPAKLTPPTIATITPYSIGKLKANATT